MLKATGVERKLSYFLRNAYEEDDIVSEIVQPLPVSVIDALQDVSHPDLLKDTEDGTGTGTGTLGKGQKWEFLLRYPVSCFGISLAISSQTVLWKYLSTSPSTSFLRVDPAINLIIWYLAAASLAAFSSLYLLKAVFYFDIVRREFRHPVRVNFFFAPLVSLLLLSVGIPHSLWRAPPPRALWYALMLPLLLLQLKVYGRWAMSAGPTRLSRVANPSVHLSVIGNFVGTVLGASSGLKEGPLFFFSVGIAHYIVLLVTLYQRLPTTRAIPRDLHPFFFLFIAAPCVASVAWAEINGSFGYASRLAYFFAMFLYTSLAVRFNLFRGFSFSIVWWAYTVPMTTAAVATIRYSTVVTNVLTQTLSVALSMIVTTVVSSLLLTTIAHAFFFKDLFPHDLAVMGSSATPP